MMSISILTALLVLATLHSDKVGETHTSLVDQTVQPYRTSLLGPIHRLEAMLQAMTGGRYFPDLSEIRDVNAHIGSLRTSFQKWLEYTSARNILAAAPQPLQLGLFLKGVSHPFLEEATLRGVDFGIEGLRLLPQSKVKMDPNILKKVLAELFENALTYTEEGWIRVYCAWEPDFEDARRGHLRIQVCDSGEGVRVEDLDDIFQPYVRISTKGSPTSLGLGLALARKLTTRHQGTLSALSDKGRGSQFTLLIPGTMADELAS